MCPQDTTLPLHPVLALDYGEARIGLAATDSCGILAHPIGTVDAHSWQAARSAILSLIKERGISHIVIGLPLLLDGTEGSSAQRVRDFAHFLQQEPRCAALPLSFFDESFSTISASQKLHEAGLSCKKQKKRIDAAAATEILNAFLGF